MLSNVGDHEQIVFFNPEICHSLLAAFYIFVGETFQCDVLFFFLNLTDCFPVLFILLEVKMASGLGVEENCISTFNEMKIRKTCRWITYAISGEKIAIEKKGSGDINEFQKALPENDCRYGVFDSTVKGKIYFVLWSPDNAPVKPRMMYAASKDALIKRLDGVAGNALEIHEKNELDSL
ncbi:actin depolymerizing factor ADF [Cardiosporidium cionae]|uniref:Actin depolymerizing factor ADF n=1 Tax=Cardiosporidium cionae TaxID=476202 RepID=A0ABQ7J906_9APIC|nr:actin depolymerizing factor ADF [Cardiosporidium cionae]|eukprot:KAF8820477.1 actin depolymerizing factor ADF [Cardiosporidium cionae]